MSKIRITIPVPNIVDFCCRHHIRRLSLFGSVLRDDFQPGSDVDVLVEFEPGYIPGFIRLAGMELELEGLFDGRKVDLRTPEDLSLYFRDEVMHKAVLLYEKH